MLPTLSALTDNPLGVQTVDQDIEPDTVAADDHEIGQSGAADQLHLDRRPSGHALDLRHRSR